MADYVLYGRNVALFATSDSISGAETLGNFLRFLKDASHMDMPGRFACSLCKNVTVEMADQDWTPLMQGIDLPNDFVWAVGGPYVLPFFENSL